MVDTESLECFYEFVGRSGRSALSICNDIFVSVRKGWLGPDAAQTC